MRKNRKRKLTVFGSVEGDREQEFLNFLMEIYETTNNNINPTLEHSSGGTPDKIVGTALTNSDRDKCFAWFDEDFEPHQPLGTEAREHLARCWNITNPDASFFQCPPKDMQKTYNANKRKPILIVSQPICVETIILKILSREIPNRCEVLSTEKKERKNQIKRLKDTLSGLIGTDNPLNYYRRTITREILEEKRRDIEELNLLIEMITI